MKAMSIALFIGFSCCLIISVGIFHILILCWSGFNFLKAQSIFLLCLIIVVIDVELLLI